MRLLSSADVPMHDRRVFMRCDLNVPLDAAGGIADDTRIRASLPGIRDVLARGGRLMVASHLGRPEEGSLLAADSLAPVARRLGELLGSDVPLAEGWLDEAPGIEPGRAVLLENCRANPGEKANSPELAMRMARLCDVYVNDAFGTAHRAEATTEGLARIAPIACAGPLMLAEIAALTRALATPRRPTAAIVGGSKVSTKLTILRSLAQQVDVLVVGGGMANTFLFAAGFRVGRSLCEPSLVEAASEVANVLARRGARLVLPEDVVVATEVSDSADARVRAVGEIADDEFVLDFGPASIRRVADTLRGCRTIVWNGPLGVFELEPFAAGTRALARIVAGSDAFTLAGGGDTVAAINRFCSVDDLDYVSTAGGAFLEFLEGRPLPALRALADRAAP